MATFIGGVTIAGLAAFHFIWINPVVLGPFALMIGMTPLVMVFEYSLNVPTYWLPIGALVSAISWHMLRNNPPRRLTLWLVLAGGIILVGFGVLAFVVASFYYDVGMAGPTPAGWYRWVRPGSQIGGVGLLWLMSWLLVKFTVGHSESTIAVAASARREK